MSSDSFFNEKDYNSIENQEEDSPIFTLNQSTTQEQSNSTHTVSKRGRKRKSQTPEEERERIKINRMKSDRNDYGNSGFIPKLCYDLGYSIKIQKNFKIRKFSKNDSFGNFAQWRNHHQ